MGRKKIKNELIESIFEMPQIPDDKLPEKIFEVVDSVINVNKRFEEAKKKKESAQKQVDFALEKAKELLDKSERLGEIQPKTRQFFSHKFSTTGDKIAALQKCVEELGEYSSDVAEYQQLLATVQSASLESQTAVMEVQKCQMEYTDRTAEAIKFLYGLSAYDISSTQLIVTNLKLILEGAEKEKLGEMAKKQMFLVMDQLKSQENLYHRIKEDEDIIDGLQCEINIQTEKHDKAIEDSIERDKRQDKILSDHEGELKSLLKQHKKQADAITDITEIQEKQEIKLRNQEIKDIEHDKEIEESKARDREQNRELIRQAKKDEEHDRLFLEKEIIDNSQDEKIKSLNDEIIRLKKIVNMLVDDSYEKSKILDELLLESKRNKLKKRANRKIQLQNFKHYYF